MIKRVLLAEASAMLAATSGLIARLLFRRVAALACGGRHRAAAVAERHGDVMDARLAPGPTSLFDLLDRLTGAEGGPPFNPHHPLWIDRTCAAAAGATLFLTGGLGHAARRGRLARAAALFAADRADGDRALRNFPGLPTRAFVPCALDVADRLWRRRMNTQVSTGLSRANGVEPSRRDRRLPFRTGRERTLDTVDRFDFGASHEAPRRLYGIDSTDPTFDQRVVELTLQMPVEECRRIGVPRALIRTAMAGRLPDVVRLERRRGLRSADSLAVLGAERGAIGEELARMAQIELQRRAIDIPPLRNRLGWSDWKVISRGWHQSSDGLMRAVSLGRFVRQAMDGTLFSSLQRVGTHCAGVAG